MRPPISSAVTICLTLCIPVNLAYANEPTAASQSAESENVLEEIRVRASRLRFGVDGYIDPEVFYDEEALRAMGVSSLAELLEEVAPDTDSGRGRQAGPPVVLVNGQRIGSFREIRNFPPEAIERVEVYPEEVALQFGYRADQKVINFVLKEKFRATVARLASATSVEGGGESATPDAGYLRIDAESRFNISLRAVEQEALHDSDRSIADFSTITPFSSTGNLFAEPEIDAQLSILAGEPVSAATLPESTESLSIDDLLPTANNPRAIEEGSFRTLIADRQEQALSATFAMPIRERWNAAVSADFQRTNTRTEQGPARVEYEVPAAHPLSPFASDVMVRKGFASVLERDQETSDLELNGTLNTRWQGWSFNWMNRYHRLRRDTSTDIRVNVDEFVDDVQSLSTNVDPFAGPADVTIETEFDEIRNSEFSSRLLTRGVLTETSAGPVNTALTVAWSKVERDAASFTSQTLSRSTLNRGTREVLFNVDVPLITSDQFGQLSANGNYRTSNYSDFDRLNGVGGGITWRPNQTIRFTGSWTREEGVPGIEQLADPLSRQQNRRLYDFRTATTTNAIVLTGGNPNLQADTRHVFSLGTRIEPFDQHNLSLNIQYVESRTEEPITGFPSPSPDLEAAFPERFTRSAGGQLLQFDTRPLNLHEERRQEIRWGLRYAKRFRAETRSHSRQGADDKSGNGVNKSSNAKSDARRVRAPGRRGASNRGGRLRLALHHTYTLQDELTFAPGLEAVDYVGINNGTRQRGGAEHEVTLRGHFSWRAFTSRFSVVWQEAVETLPGQNGVLDYDDLTRVNLDFVYTFPSDSAWVQRYPLFDAARVKLSVQNLLDDKPTVRDQFGLVPLGFSEDELDPRGRTIALEFRKLFR